MNESINGGTVKRARLLASTVREREEEEEEEEEEDTIASGCRLHIRTQALRVALAAFMTR